MTKNIMDKKRVFRRIFAFFPKVFGELEKRVVQNRRSDAFPFDEQFVIDS